MALILSIDTTTNVCSVALSEGSKIIALKEERKEEKSHNALLTQYIQGLFDESGLKLKDIAVIAFSNGPGSYTGLRIGCSVAKSIAYSLNKPIVAINTLQALSWRCRASLEQQELLFVPMMDARRMDVYTSVYDSSLNELEAISMKTIEANMLDDYKTKHSIVFFGNGADKAKDILVDEKVTLVPAHYNSATNLVALAQDALEKKDFVDVAYFEPNYLSKYLPRISKKIVL